MNSPQRSSRLLRLSLGSHSSADNPAIPDEDLQHATSTKLLTWKVESQHLSHLAQSLIKASSRVKAAQVLLAKGVLLATASSFHTWIQSAGKIEKYQPYILKGTTKRTAFSVRKVSFPNILKVLKCRPFGYNKMTLKELKIRKILVPEALVWQCDSCPDLAASFLSPRQKRKYEISGLPEKTGSLDGMLSTPNTGPWEWQGSLHEKGDVWDTFEEIQPIKTQLGNFSCGLQVPEPK